MKDKKQSRNLLSIYQEKGTILQNRKGSLMQKNKKLQLRQRKHRKNFKITSRLQDFLKSIMK